jgi:membrane protein implicated in regulation of membrane protease activity
VVHDIGRFLLVIGVVIALIGLLLWGGFFPRWLGRLPGDIRIQRGNFSLYFPIVTCIVISVLLTLIFSLFRR